MKFTKMEGLGNDYVYIDLFEEKVADAPALAVRMSDRHFGVGSDGLILIGPSERADARMEMYNADGSRAGMCGNGIRCVAKYVYEHGIARKETLDVETDAGVKRLELFVSQDVVERVRVHMGRPQLDRAHIPMKGARGRVVDEELRVLDRTFRVTALSMGNPHCVTFVDDAVAFPVETWGPAIETHPAFPERVNAEFVEVIDRGRLLMRVWERGAGETLACGTGACASTVAGVLTGVSDRALTVQLRGGDLAVEWSADTDAVWMTGPAREVFRGEWSEAE